MVVNYIDDLEEFFDLVRNKCKNDVFLVTDDGDRISLNSKISRFMLEVLNSSELIGEFEIEANDDDKAVIVEYLHNKKTATE